MEIFQGLIKNHVLVCAVVSWIAAQLVKTLLFYMHNKEFNAERLVGAGGMPSCHSAAVCSAAIAVANTAGISSPEFAVSFLLACIVIYDATGVRRAAGEHAKILNKMIDELPPEQLEDFFKKKDVDASRFREILIKAKLSHEVKDEDDILKPLKEFLGHTPIEVIAGALLGIIIAMIIPVI